MHQSIFKINDTLVYPEKNQLQRNNETIEVTPKSVEILQFLTRNKGKLVSYQQLSDEIWNGSVSEGALYQQMTQLRRALGDNPASPSFIKTIPRKGYKFIANISETTIKSDQKPTQTSGKKYLSRKTAWYLSAALSITALTLLTSFLFNKKHNDYSSIDKYLKMPDQHIVLVKEDNEKLYNTGAILSFLLENSSDYHFSLTDKYGNDPLQNHIRTNTRSKITKLKLSLSGHHISLSINNHNNSEILTFHHNKSDYNKLQTLNIWLQASLSKANISIPETISFNQDSSSENSLIEAIKDSDKYYNSRLEVENSRDRSLRALMLNPKNLLAYSLFFDRTSDLLNLSGGFNLDQSLKQLQQQALKSLKLSPKYHKSHYALAEVYCNLEDNENCLKHLTSALNKNPYYHATLSATDWILSRNNIDRGSIAKYNFLLNPEKNDSRTFYRNQLIANHNLHKASQIMNEVSFASLIKNTDINWAYLAQITSTMDNGMRFANYYRRNLSLAKEEKLIIPSKYIAYKFIDSNRPQMAKFWLQKGKGNTQEYLEIQIAELIISLISNTYTTDKWHAIRSLAEDRANFQDPLDKLRLAYFDYHNKNLNLSKENLLEFYPNLSSDELVIDRNNFRVAVYYAEILKKQGNFKMSFHINKKLRTFLQLNDAFSERDNDIGIADIEFYALNGDSDKAMERLSLAVEQQDWLPNAYWLWLPPDKDPFLASLYHRDDFKALNAKMKYELNQLCFDRSCPQKRAEENNI